MMRTLTSLFLVSRPISWINTAYPFAAGYLVLGGTVDPMYVVATLFFLIPYNLLMYGVNDVFDYESDLRNPRKGGIEGAREAKALHRPILISSILLTLPFVIALVVLGDMASSLILAGVLFMVVAYSMKGLRFKEIPVLDSVTSSIHFVGPFLFALSLFDFPASAWPYVLVFFLWGMASHAFGAVQDVVPDREGKLASIATVFGARNTVRFSVVLYIASSLLLFGTGWSGVAVGVAGLLYAFNCSPYWNVSDADSGNANKAWRRFIWLNLITGAAVTITLLTLFVY